MKTAKRQCVEQSYRAAGFEVSEELKDFLRLDDLYRKLPDKESAPVKLFHAQTRMVIRNFVRAMTPEELKVFCDETADQVWEAACTPGIPSPIPVALPDI
jgi:hypothetical protein